MATRATRHDPTLGTLIGLALCFRCRHSVTNGIGKGSDASDAPTDRNSLATCWHEALLAPDSIKAQYCNFYPLLTAGRVEAQYRKLYASGTGLQPSSTAP